MTKRLLIIPARGNSKRIKNKNIKYFYGKPIISYSIKLALKSKLFDKIHVSSDSKKILKVSNKIKFGIGFKREKKLAKDSTPLFDVFLDVVNHYKQMKIYYDEIWYINPCSPLIKNVDLVMASKKIKSKKINSILSIAQYSPPTQWAFKKTGIKITPVNSDFQSKRSQDLSKTFYDSGNFGGFKGSVFYKKQKIIFGGIEIPRERAIDIDTIIDWKMAKKLFN